MREQSTARWDDPAMWESGCSPRMEICELKWLEPLPDEWFGPLPDVVRDASAEGKTIKPDEPKGEEEKPQP